MNINLNINKLLAEFFSTFILIYTGLTTKSTIYKILSIIFIISFFNRHYGANFNPLVSFIHLIGGEIRFSQFLLYILGQGLGGLTAYFIFNRLNLG